MPLLQGQPFKLVKPLETYSLDSEVYTIQHTGEKFLNKSDYEDRLALYRQSIWTCQCTGHTGLTHQEAWMSEAKVRITAKTAVPLALQRPLLVLVHHSLSPLEQLIDAASVLCYSQYHVGEELLLLHPPKQVPVRVAKAKDAPKMCESDIGQSIANGIISCDDVSLHNGNTHNLSKGDSPGTSPGKENQAKEMNPPKEDAANRKGMLPKLYDVITLEDKKLIENVLVKNLVRPYKVPSKDQLRLFIRSFALRHRGTTCTPWVVADDLIKKFNIPNKLPSVFLSSPKPNQTPAKRKSLSPVSEPVKRPKSDSLCNKPSGLSTTKVSPLVIKSQNSQQREKSNKKVESSRLFKLALKRNSPHSSVKLDSKPPWGQSVKTPLSLEKPSGFLRPSNISAPNCDSLPTSKINPPRKRGRPPLTKEEKERNKKLRQATLLELSNKMKSLEGNVNVLKIQTHCDMQPPPRDTSSSIPKSTHPLMSPYRSPVKRANSPESIMKLPFMRRFLHEHKTIKGVLGQFRRYAHTLDLVLSKLSAAQIEMIPFETLKHDLLSRQKKVRDKKFFETLTPEQRKQFLKDKARTVALERWKERKLRNLKIEDKTISGLLPLPQPSLVETPKPIPNFLFGDIVLTTEFIKCFHELLLGEEKFQFTTSNIMEAITVGVQGCKVIADIICCLLPLIIHDDISKNCKEIGIPISSIPITYQTAQELARLCLRKQDEVEVLVSTGEENYQLGEEENELSDELLAKLESCELWELNSHEIVAVLTALVHKALCTASLSVYMEEFDDKVLQALRERRHFLKQIQREQRAGVEKRKEERLQNRMAKSITPKKQRGRPRGYSPKLGSIASPHDYFGLKEEKNSPSDGHSLSIAVHQRRLSTELQKKEKAEMLRLEKEKQKQSEESQKRKAIDRKYEDLVFKRDNLLRRTPIGFDRDHNRYWIFHSTTPGLYVEKGWVHQDSNSTYSLHQNSNGWIAAKIPVKLEMGSEDEDERPLSLILTKSENQEDEDNKPLSFVKSKIQKEMEEDNQPLSTVKSKLLCSPMNSDGSTVPRTPDKGKMVNENEDGSYLSTIVDNHEKQEDEDNKPLSFVKSKIKKEMDEDNQPLSTVKSKLLLSPMKMTYRGRHPKEAYVLVDEDTQTFPPIGENKWYCYQSMAEVEMLLSCLSDQGQRESQLIAAIDINKEKLDYHFNKKGKAMNINLLDFSHCLKESLKEDIIQIERELIEGWLGGVPNFDEWEKNAQEAEDVSTLGNVLIQAQRCMNIKYLKCIMTPVRDHSIPIVDVTTAEPEGCEGSGVQCWRDAVQSCKTYSRLHVLVGVFDSCIKWEKSMATRKCKVCRSKVQQDPVLMCTKCENSYHMYCLRPPLKEDPGEFWYCPACMPKKTRREETQVHSMEVEPDSMDQEEKNDPTYTLNSNRKAPKKRKKCLLDTKSTDQLVKQERKCVVCFGRVGLIVCSKCSTAYHSECHDPPLISRARKDWVCGACVNPSKANSQEKLYEDQKTCVRRNYFGNLEEIMVKKRTGNSGPRDQFGRFLRGSYDALASDQEPSSTGEKEEAGQSMAEPAEHVDEMSEQTMEKLTRFSRGAKTKALVNMDPKQKSARDNRRSSRNCDKPKNYRYESEDSTEEVANENEEEEELEEESEIEDESQLGERLASEYSSDCETDESEVQAEGEEKERDEEKIENDDGTAAIKSFLPIHDSDDADSGEGENFLIEEDNIDLIS